MRMCLAKKKQVGEEHGTTCTMEPKVCIKSHIWISIQIIPMQFHEILISDLQFSSDKKTQAGEESMAIL